MTEVLKTLGSVAAYEWRRFRRSPVWMIGFPAAVIWLISDGRSPAGWPPVNTSLHAFQVVVSVLIGLLAPGPGSTTERSLVAISGVMILVLIVGTRPVKRAMVRVGQHYARRRLLPALVVGPEELLTLGQDFSVTAVRVAESPAETYRSLRGLEHAIPGARVLGVRRGTEYFGEPPVDLTLLEGDELVVYGRNDRLGGLGAPSGGSSPS